MRSILIKFNVQDVGNQNTYGVNLKREVSNGDWKIVMPDGTEPQYDYLVQLFADRVPEVIHYLDNMEADAAAANATFNTGYVSNVVTPFLRNDPAPDNSSGYITTLDTILL